MLRGRDGTFAE